MPGQVHAFAAEVTTGATTIAVTDAATWVVWILLIWYHHMRRVDGNRTVCDVQPARGVRHFSVQLQRLRM